MSAVNPEEIRTGLKHYERMKYMDEKVIRHKDICLGLNNLYARKNHDYGDSFHQTFVEEGMAMPRIRLGDKFSRFKTLTQSGGQQVTDESIRDTLMDLANYAIMTILEMDEIEKDCAEEKNLAAAVKELSESGATLSAISNQMGITRYRVRKLIERAVHDHEK